MGRGNLKLMRHWGTAA